MIRNIITTSVEYLDVSVTADVPLTVQTVEFSFDNETWTAAEWIGDPGTTRTARLLVDETVMPRVGTHQLYIRVTDNPEVPVLVAGEVRVR